jgi:hypothetical protein
VSLYDSVRAELPFLRAQAESLMTDTFAAYSPNGTTEDADDFQTTAFATETPTIGKIQASALQQSDTGTRYVRVGTVDRPVVSGGLHIPIAAAPPKPGWEYQCTAIGPTSDPSLLGRRWRVVDAPAKTHATARRLDVVEVTP